MNDLIVDNERLESFGISLPRSGIYVRAKLIHGPDEGEHAGSVRWGNYDIAALTIASLKEWLRSRNGFNPWAEQVVAALLRYPNQQIVETWPATEAQ